MTRYRATLIGLLILAAGSAPASRSGAQTSDTTAVIVAAVRRIRSDYASGRTVIGVVDSIRVSAAARDMIARALEADTGSLAAFHRCDGSGPGGCHLRGAAVFVTVGGYTQVRDSGRVNLRVYEETSSTRQPIHGAEVVVTVVRRGAQWEVSSVRQIWES